MPLDLLHALFQNHQRALLQFVALLEFQQLLLQRLHFRIGGGVQQGRGKQGGHTHDGAELKALTHEYVPVCRVKGWGRVTSHIPGRTSGIAEFRPLIDGLPLLITTFSWVRFSTLLRELMMSVL
ncbi:hypothetical protein D3C80_1764510 [compost metagenome]